MRRRWFLAGAFALLLAAAGGGAALTWQEAFDRAVQSRGARAPLLFARDYAHAIDDLTTITATAKLATIVHVLDAVTSHPADFRAVAGELATAERAMARAVVLGWVRADFADRRTRLTADETELRDGLR